MTEKLRLYVDYETPLDGVIDPYQLIVQAMARGLDVRQHLPELRQSPANLAERWQQRMRQRLDRLTRFIFGREQMLEPYGEEYETGVRWFATRFEVSNADAVVAIFAPDSNPDSSPHMSLLAASILGKRALAIIRPSEGHGAGVIQDDNRERIVACTNQAEASMHLAQFLGDLGKESTK